MTQSNSTMKKFNQFCKQCREWKYANIVIFLTFTLTLFSQCVFFHWQAFHSILISSLWKDPISFFAFYLLKLSICVIIASFVFLFRNKVWTIIVSFILNFWLISQLVYNRANRIFMDHWTFTMIKNMDGFWDSVPMYIQPTDLKCFIFSLIIVLTVYLFSNKNKSFLLFVISLIVGIIISISGCLLHCYHRNMETEREQGVTFSERQFYYINPFNKKAVHTMFGFTTADYLRDVSIIHGIIFDIKSLVLIPFENESYVLSQEEKKIVKVFFNKNDSIPYPKYNLQLILVESFENWSINDTTTPNIYNFLKNHKDHILYIKKSKSQTRGGTSADGQMIVNTGVLPIVSGATCFKFPYNLFPSLSELYSCSNAVIPTRLDVWNQKSMSDAYHITNNIVTITDDKDVFSVYDSIKQTADYNLVVTVSSHNPFTSYGAANSKLNTDKEMPTTMSDYLRSINYMDEQFGTILSQIDTCKYLKESIIVITGDHIIFPNEHRKQFNEYCTSSNKHYSVLDAYCPVIIYAPNIEKGIVNEDICYQMDIYPTVLHLIGCEDYYWKGFGVNLLDEEARKHRPITEEDAFELSDKIIRANYFKTYLDSIKVVQ